MTDADAVLGYLPVDGFAGGRMHLDLPAARTAITEHVAKPLGIEITDAAWGIERIVNSNMANATRKVLAGHGADPRDLALIAFGGNGAVHAVAIARELGVARILVPKAAPAFSALGVLVADYVVDLVRSYVIPLSQVDLGRVRRVHAGDHDRHVVLVAERRGRAEHGGRLRVLRLELAGGVGLDGGEHDVDVTHVEPVAVFDRQIEHGGGGLVRAPPPARAGLRIGHQSGIG